MAILKLGTTGPEVASLVADLTAAGFAPQGGSDNRFDGEVRNAVRRFQSVGVGPDGLPLVVDGEVGPLTQYALDVANGRKPPPLLMTMPAPNTVAKTLAASVTGWNALRIAKAEMAAGASESGGDNRGPFVEKYHAVTGAAPGDSWCASFVSFCFKEGNPGNMPYAATAGARATRDAFRKKGWTFDADFDNPPEPGDIIVWWRGTIDGWMGHIGIVSGYENGIVHTIEGNRGSFPSKVSAYHYKLGKIDRLLGFGRAQP